MTVTASLYAILAGLLAGAFALAFVANEIGGRAGLSPPGRLLLAGGLGFGVLAFAIKAVLIHEISTMDRETLAPGSRPAAWVPVDDGYWPERPPVSPFWATWQALPSPPSEPATGSREAARIALGKRLFNDPDLSRDRTVACASCHGLAGGGDDGRRVSLGVGGAAGARNAPTVIDAAYLVRLFWDGRAGSLEEQAAGPLLNPIEMAMPSEAAVLARIREKPAYTGAFAAAFGADSPLTFREVTEAIAAFERTLVSRGAAYDRFVAGDDAALDPAARRGMALFHEIGCRNCHVDPTFSAAGRQKSHGIYRPFPVFRDEALVRRYRLDEEKRGVWRVPSLRNVELTAPYFHNGSAETLEEAVRAMASLQLGRIVGDEPAGTFALEPGAVEPGIAGTGDRRPVAMTRPRTLSDGDVADLVAFLRSLTGWPVIAAGR